MEDQTSANKEMRYKILVGLLSTILIILTYRYINFLWRRRKLYISSWNIPGPFAFPLFGNAHLFYKGLDGLSKVCDNLANTYPDISRLWIGPKLVHFILKPEYIEKILCNKLERADWVNDIISNNFAGHGLLFSPFTIWKRHRKVISPSFGQTILNSYMDKFNERAEILRDQLQKHIGEINFDLREKIFNYALDIICETLMGVTVDFQTTDSNVNGNDLNRSFEIIIKKIYNPWYHIDIIWKLSSLYKELNDLKVNIRKSDLMCKIYGKINRRQENCNHMDETQDAYKKKLPFLDWILETSHFTETEIKDEIDTFTAAGSDTTTIAICCSIMTMAMHQDIQEKVYEEVMEICGPTRKILPSDINKLKYTERVIKESLRLFPPAPFMIRKIDADLDLGEHTLPEGSSSIFCTRTIHTNSKYWPNPYEFDPDRFLPENSSKRHPCAYIAFSYGSRNCIGGRFAMMAILTTFAILIRRFKFFTEYKTIEEIELIPTIVLELKDGYKVWLELR